MIGARTVGATGAIALVVGCVVGLPVGCVVEPAPTRWPAGDPLTFAAEVQPTLATRCANPSCHGQPGVLELFAERLHRREAAALWGFAPLELAELRHNQREIEARIRPDRPDASPILRMCLPGRDGHRHSGPIADAHEPDYIALRDWVRAAAEGP